MKSKKLMIFAICAVMALTAAGCGSKNKSSDAAPSAQQSSSADSGQNNGSSDNKDSSDSGEKAQGDEKNNGNDSSGGANNSDEEKSDINTMDQLQGKVDEFNNTDDPERKEELRKELENFIRQAEKDAVTASDK